VRGVGQKAALVVEHVLDAGQQLVERVGQRRHLGGQSGGVDGLQAFRVAAGNVAAQLLQRQQHAVHARAREHRQHQHQQHQRHQQPRCEGVEVLAPDLGGDRNLDNAAVVRLRVHAPALALPGDDVVSRPLQGRADIGQRGVDQLPRVLPDLAHKLVEVVIGQRGRGQRCRGLRRRRFVVAHDRLGDLFQPHVAHVVEAAPCQPRGQVTDHQGGDQHRGDQPEQQPGADRAQLQGNCTSL
jgi:cell division protein ZapA (FtsZ GTPase activity inhibitor)